ncbi:uncharacterized protein METZ01_LOCUS317952, partial [marine metagenome]
RPWPQHPARPQCPQPGRHCFPGNWGRNCRTNPEWM